MKRGGEDGGGGGGMLELSGGAVVERWQSGSGDSRGRFESAKTKITNISNVLLGKGS